MKQFPLFFFFLITAISLQAQPEFHTYQLQWIEDVKSGISTENYYWANRHLFYSKITTSDSESLVQLLRSEAIPNIETYNHLKTFKHDRYRYLTVGYLKTTSESLLLLSGWRDVEGNWKKEIDVVLTRETDQNGMGQNSVDILDQHREKWVMLANKHDPNEHIRKTYSEDATYFSNGYKSNGWQEIIERYAYMENPDYQVDLEKEQLWRVSDTSIVEVGRYFTGAERVGPGGLYVILWEKQNPDTWQITLDFNF